MMKGGKKKRVRVKASIYRRGAGGSHEGLVKHFRSGEAFFFLKTRVSYFTVLTKAGRVSSGRRTASGF